MNSLYFGVDMEIGSSPHAKRTATYSVYIDLVQPRNLTGVTNEQLLSLVREYQPELIATDNFLELTGSTKKLNSFISKLGNTKLVQVTFNNQTQHPLTSLARSHLGWRSGKPTSSETAKICVELAKIGIGSILKGYIKRTLQIQDLDQQYLSTIDVKSLHPIQKENPYLAKRKILMNFGKGKDAIIYLSEYQGDYHVIKYYDPYSPSIGKLDKSYSHAKNSHITMAKRESRLLKQLNGPFPSPNFIERSGSIVVMDAIGNFDGDRFYVAPKLSQYPKSDFDAEEVLNQSFDLLLSLIRDYGIVHGDFSPQNVLKSFDDLFLIDFAQGYEINLKSFTDTPYKIRLDRALTILQADIQSFSKYYFKRHRVHINLQEIYQTMIKVFPNNLLDLCDPYILDPRLGFLV